MAKVQPEFEPAVPKWNRQSISYWAEYRPELLETCCSICNQLSKLIPFAAVTPQPHCWGGRGMWFQVTVLGRDKQKGSLRDLLAVSPSGYLGCELLCSQAQHQCQHSNKSFPDRAEFTLSKCLTLVFTIFKVSVFCLWVLPLATFPLWEPTKGASWNLFCLPTSLPKCSQRRGGTKPWDTLLVGRTAAGAAPSLGRSMPYRCTGYSGVLAWIIN